MSYITHVLIQGASQAQIDSLNGWLAAHDDRKQSLQPINMDMAGGTKYYVCDVFAAAFNYLPGGFVEKLKDPETWGTRVRMISLVIDGEERSMAFCFDKPFDQYLPVTEQAYRD